MLIIKPIMDNSASNKLTISELQLQVIDAQTAAAQEAIVNKALAEAVSVINTEGNLFYNPMTTWDAERRVTKIMHDNNVEYHAILISDPKPFINPPLEGDTPSDAEAPVVATGIQEITMTVECHTSTEKLNEVLDDFYALDKKATISTWNYEYDELTMKIKAFITITLYSIQ